MPVQRIRYLAEYGDGLWGDKTEEVRAAVVAAMRADWERHSARVLTAWRERTPHEIEMARRHCDQAQPWAMINFGDPECNA